MFPTFAPTDEICLPKPRQNPCDVYGRSENSCANVNNQLIRQGSVYRCQWAQNPVGDKPYPMRCYTPDFPNWDPKVVRLYPMGTGKCWGRYAPAYRINDPDKKCRDGKFKNLQSRKIRHE
jgi:hypothetical protein